MGTKKDNWSTELAHCDHAHNLSCDFCIKMRLICYICVSKLKKNKQSLKGKKNKKAVYFIGSREKKKKRNQTSANKLINTPWLEWKKTLGCFQIRQKRPLLKMGGPHTCRNKVHILVRVWDAPYNSFFTIILLWFLNLISRESKPFSFNFIPN